MPRLARPSGAWHHRVMLTLALLPLALLQSAAEPSLPPSAGRMIETRSDADGLTFAFAWPEAIESEPGLKRWFVARRDAQKAEALKDALEDGAATRADGRDFSGHDFEESWSMRAKTARLVSLTGSNARFTGGAHGSLNFLGKLWDRRSGRDVAPADLFGRAGLAPFRGRFCDAVNAERSERRGEPIQPTADDDFMTGCPKFADVVAALEDVDGDGRIDTMAFDIAPYVAGPWAEGPYNVEVALTADDIGRVARAYREDFAAAK